MSGPDTPASPAPDAGESPDKAIEPTHAPGPAAEEAAPAQTPQDDELAALRTERDSLVDQLLRRRADFENYKRRVERERQNMASEACAELIKDLLPSLDNLERALAARGAEESLHQGVQLIERELRAALDARGLRVEDPTGAPFDPAWHQALAHEVVPGAVPGTVVETFRKAYLFRERLLRPALVKVAKEPEPAEPGETETEALQ